MRNRIFVVLTLVVLLSVVLAACATGGGTTGGTTAGKKLKVGLITDVGGVNDKSFNQSAWAGVQKAMKELCVDGKFIESKQPTDYEKNIDQFATEKYDAILTVGFLMGDATAAKAKQYPTSSSRSSTTPTSPPKTTPSALTRSKTATLTVA